MSIYIWTHQDMLIFLIFVVLFEGFLIQPVLGCVADSLSVCLIYSLISLWCNLSRFSLIVVWLFQDLPGCVLQLLFVSNRCGGKFLIFCFPIFVFFLLSIRVLIEMESLRIQKLVLLAFYKVLLVFSGLISSICL